MKKPPKRAHDLQVFVCYLIDPQNNQILAGSERSEAARSPLSAFCLPSSVLCPPSSIVPVLFWDIAPAGGHRPGALPGGGPAADAKTASLRTRFSSGGEGGIRMASPSGGPRLTREPPPCGRGSLLAGRAGFEPAAEF